MSAWRFFCETFGCKVNQYETQSIREAWTALGGIEVKQPEKADWILINSCAVTAQAVSDARQAARRMHRLAPHATIIVTGCSATAAKTELHNLPGVTAVVPQMEKKRLLGGPAMLAGQDTSGPGSWTEAASTADAVAYPPFSITSFVRSRPVLKLQDGCSHRCTYCIVPLTRGPARSRSTANVLTEARHLLATGYRELILSGINLQQYRDPDSDGDFWDLVTALDAALAPSWTGHARMRISSLDPSQLGQKALDVLGSVHLLCPHLHLSIQSGSPDVLKKMGRGHYSPQNIIDEIHALQTVWPVFGLGADILLGFPGESDENAKETLQLMEELPLSYAHIFPFSVRPGTPAAAMQDLPVDVKQQRTRLARQLIKKKHRDFLRSLVQRRTDVFVARDIVPGSTPATPVSTVKGVNEFYVACLVNLPEGSTISGHELIRATPVGIADNRLIANGWVA